MLKSPADLVWMFAIFGLIVITIGFGVSDVISHSDDTIDESYFTTIEGNLNSSSGLQGASSRVSDTLGAEGEGGEESETGLLTEGYHTMQGLGQVWALTKNAMQETSNEINIPPIYWQVLSTLLIISFFIVLYTWLRGKS